MQFLLGLIGMVGAFAILHQREMVGDLIGGRYSLAIGIGVLLFFWSVAYMVGATDIFFRPLLWLLPIN